jgi:predicted nuclease of predicted toxin-antitoxin system
VWVLKVDPARILADENLHAEIVQWLREAGHSVLWAAEELRGTGDSDLLALAHRERRIILTNDRDFGELVVRRGFASAGVIFLRFRASSGDEVLRAFQARWPEIETAAEGSFIVATNEALRVRPLPADK